MSYFNSPLMQDIITVLAVLVASYLHRHKPQIEQEVAQILPQPEAQITNEILDLLDQVTESAVQNANLQIVNGLKQHNLFTPDTAKAIKQSVLDSVVGKFPGQDITWITSQLIEKHVAQKKTP